MVPGPRWQEEGTAAQAEEAARLAAEESEAQAAVAEAEAAVNSIGAVEHVNEQRTLDPNGKSGTYGLPCRKSGTSRVLAVAVGGR